MLPGMIGWVVVGVLVGFIASKFVNLRGDDPKLGMAAAVFGAFVGAIIYRIASGVEVSAWNWHSLACAGLGAIIAVIVWHLIRSKTISHTSYRARQSH